MHQNVIFQKGIIVYAISLMLVSALFLAMTPTAFSAERIIQSAALPVSFYDPKVQGHEEPFPGYAERCGFQIFLQSTRHVSLAVTAADGSQIIFIDPLLTKRGNEFHKAFLIAHECAHHRLGHTSKEGLNSRWSSGRAVSDQELSADCWAAETLSRAGLRQFTNTMSLRMRRSGLFSPGGGYPAGVQRASIIRECAASGERQFFARNERTSIVK